MTAKHHKRIAGLLAPRRPLRFKALPEDYGKNPLDLSMDELRPDRMQGLISWSRLEDSQSSKSEIVKAALIYVTNPDHGYTPSVNDDGDPDFIDLDLRGFCEDAKLTPRQTEVIVLAGEGWNQRAIGEWLNIAQTTVWQHLHHGRRKLAGRLPLDVAMRLANTYQEAYIGGAETRLRA